MAASVIKMVVCSILVAAFSRQLADEFKAWTPWLIRKLVALAVRRLPEHQRERYSEEWRSYVAEIPGEVGKVLAALGLLRAGIMIGYDFRRDSRLGASSGIRDGKTREKRDISPIRRLATIAAVMGGLPLVSIPAGVGVLLLIRRVGAPAPYNLIEQIVALSLICAASMTWIKKGEHLLLRRLPRGATRSGS